MAATRIPSFTERALLNSAVLDWICPPNCAKRNIRQEPGHSILETLFATNVNPYSNAIDTSYWHWTTKPAKATARVLYTALVTCAVAPAGIAVNGAMTAKNLALYFIATCQSSNEQTNAAWEKTKLYAKAFFTDTTSFILGAVFSGSFVAVIIFLPSILLEATLGSRIFIAMASLALAGGMAFLLGGFDHESAIPQLIGWDDERVGMYLTLALRNQLGLVDGQGGLLKFSQKDRLEYTPEGRGYALFTGESHNLFTELVINAELELLDKVREANHHLTQQGKNPIPFSYPFDANQVAKLISTQCPNNEKAGQLIDSLRILGYKVQTFLDLYRSAKQLTLEDSVWVMFMKGFGGVRPTDVHISREKTLLLEDFYQQSFELPFEDAVSKNLGPALDNLGLQGIDPEAELPPEIQPQGAPPPLNHLLYDCNHLLYDCFKKDVLENKWKKEHGQPLCTPHSLLGLEENCSFADYREACRDLALALHPDKNLERTDEARALFQVFQTIKALLDEEFEKQPKTP